MDEEIIEKFYSLKTTVNSIKNFDNLLPSEADINSITALVHWIAYFINPSWVDIDNLVLTYGIELDKKERENIYPLIIDFILFVKEKFTGPTKI